MHYQQYLSSLNVRVLFCWVVSLEFSECSSSRPLPSPSTQATLYLSSWNLDEDTYNDKEQYTCDEKLVSTSNVIKTKKGNNFPWLLLHSQFYLLRYITVEQHGEEDWAVTDNSKRLFYRGEDRYINPLVRILRTQFCWPEGSVLFSYFFFCIQCWNNLNLILFQLSLPTMS